MLKNITCPCGQQLDVSDYYAGEKVQCPTCQQIHTIGGDPPAADGAESTEPAPPQAADAPPPTPPDAADAPPTPPTDLPLAVAVALPDDDDDESPPPVAGGPGRVTANDFVARRKRAEKRAAAQQSNALQRVLVWPALIFALLALGIGSLGVYLRTMPPKLERVTDNGIERIFVHVPLDEQNLEFERIEVQPDIYPGDQVRSRGTYTPGESPFLLNGEPLDWGTYGRDELKQRIFGVAMKADGGGTTMIPVVRRGLWFHRYHEGKAAERLDLPLIGGMRSGSNEHEPVIFHDQNFYYRQPNGSRGDLVDVAWYKISPDGVQEQPMGVGQFREQLFMGLRPHQVANLFALGGFAIGLVLLALGGLMLYGTRLSPAAKQQNEQRRLFAEEQKSKQAANAEQAS